MSDRRSYILGIDGGATKTVALLGDEHGKTLGRGETGSSNYHNIGPLAASKALRRAARAAQTNANTLRLPDIAVVALAGIDSTKHRNVALRFVRSSRIARSTYVVHDSIAALRAATRGQPGIIVIAGTGCIAAGINAEGNYARAGGWGYLVDDEGSAYDIGHKALAAAFRYLDGRGAPTKLAAIFNRRFKVEVLSDAMNKIYRELTVDDVAALAPLVSSMAPYDNVSRQILNDAGVGLAELVGAVAKRLSMTRNQFVISTVGGTFHAGRYLSQPFMKRIRKRCPLARVVVRKIDPASGALSLAYCELQRRRSLARKSDEPYLAFLK
jgi:N-acetylglucosamine kinase-like BadF-type ATPase